MIKLQHDEIIDVAFGQNRHSKNWKNKQIAWSEIVNRISKTHRTAETYAAYISSKKERQDEIKDIGGFVGGYLSGGRRKKGSVLHRQIISLDIDFAKSYLWDDFVLLYDCAGAIYSTHKHSAETQRYRLLIPLDRPVFCEEYAAVARRIAGDIGIDFFDNSTFQPERLMYWPSTAADGEYVFDYQDGEFLSADKVLQSYRNWQDVSEWPISEKYKSAVTREAKKQGDPLEKPGIIGAFCRTFNIHDTITKYLSEIYTPTDFDGRYTFTGGSTAAGLIVYEDKFAYSHHGTDPISGKLCNAFDLVRIHLFGLKDEDAREDTPVNKLPSFAAMQELAMKDKAVVKLVVSEKISGALEDFGLTPENAAEDETETQQDGETEAAEDWQSQLEVTRKGQILSTINNVVIILNSDPKLKNRIAYNEFEKRDVALNPLPWHKPKKHSTEVALRDADDANLRRYLESVYGISGKEKITDATNIVCDQNAFHPVREYLNSCKWDGIPRIDTMLIDYLGAEHTDYSKAISRKMMAAAVSRIFDPGIKFDQVCVLVGKQGLKKSMLIDKLGGQWYSDSITTLQGKEAYEALQGVWLIELAELSALKTSEVETVKHFVSKRKDRYRVAYGKRLEEFLRQCIFWATTNKWNFLKDDKNRRFWPVPVHVCPPVYDVAKMTPAIVCQLWAEAVEAYKAGEKLYLEDELLKDAEEMQEQHKEQDERTGLVLRYLETLVPENWAEMGVYDRRAFLNGDELSGTGTVQRDRISIPEIWAECFGGQMKDLTKRTAFELHSIMESLPGWEKYPTKARVPFYGVQRVYDLGGKKMLIKRK